MINPPYVYQMDPHTRALFCSSLFLRIGADEPALPEAARPSQLPHPHQGWREIGLVLLPLPAADVNIRYFHLLVLRALLKMCCHYHPGGLCKWKIINTPQVAQDWQDSDVVFKEAFFPGHGEVRLSEHAHNSYSFGGDGCASRVFHQLPWPGTKLVGPPWCVDGKIHFSRVGKCFLPVFAGVSSILVHPQHPSK